MSKSDTLDQNKGPLPKRVAPELKQAPGPMQVPRIYAHFYHLGEELMLVPSFIINLAGCNLSCPTCPERCHWSASAKAIQPSAESYAAYLLERFKRESWPKTIQWIGGEPTLYLPYVLAVSRALKSANVNCPPIYLNTNAYFEPSRFEAMEGAIDAFVFDLKAAPGCEKIVGGTSNYWDVATKCIAHGLSQHPHIEANIVRHLVMPGHFDCCTVPILAWLVEHCPEVNINLMTSFQNFDGVDGYPACLSPAEIEQARDYACKLSVVRLWINGARTTCEAQ